VLISRRLPPAGALIVDDDPFTRGMLAAAVQGLGWSPVRSASSVAEALWVARHLEPSVAVLDLDLGEGPTGVDLAIGLRHTYPGIGLIIISTYEEPRLNGLNLPPMPEGAVYLVKRTVTDSDVLGHSLQLAVAPQRMGPSANAIGKPPSPGISDESIEVMRLVSAGHSNAEIARLRVMSVSGVEKVVARLIRHFVIPGGKESSQRVLIAQAYFRLTGAVSSRRG
jgi:DNA-binding NarL/FixJ family response regulator